MFGFPDDASHILKSQNVWSEVLPLLLYVLANAIVCFFALYVRAITAVLATLFRVLFARFVAH